MASVIHILNNFIQTATGALFYIFKQFWGNISTFLHLNCPSLHTLKEFFDFLNVGTSIIQYMHLHFYL